MCDYIINIYLSELLCTKTKEFRINEHKNIFKKCKFIYMYGVTSYFIYNCKTLQDQTTGDFETLALNITDI